MKPLDSNVLPKTPVIMMTASGDTLESAVKQFEYVQLERDEQGKVSIRGCKKAEHDMYLSHKFEDGWTFRPGLSCASKFTTKVSSAGNIIFEDWRHRALAIKAGWSNKKHIKCNKAFKGKLSQEWLLLQQHKFTASPTVVFPISNLQYLAAESCGSARKQLVLELVKCGHSGDSASAIVKFLYGPSIPVDLEANMDSASVERRQLIIQFVESNKSTQEIGKMLEALYGTTDPLPPVMTGKVKSLEKLVGGTDAKVNTKTEE
ncbi:hypothetical protein PHYBOEH_005066 [Phytophthora boehmeriae]|uniref:Uncharacterized protein n=1 Tax=Phytophthora boehmeriae TaxID=109152 RepID=A0A8T1WRH6_9STRA|nr:hypothetical protein PHYBOEH_005066 [Phytophthora boehmeriae]